jgi:hypothetical protein
MVAMSEFLIQKQKGGKNEEQEIDSALFTGVFFVYFHNPKRDGRG